MANVYSAIASDANAKGFLATVGTDIFYDVAQAYANAINETMMLALSAFVQPMQTENHSERQYLPGSGELQDRNEQGRFADTRPTGYWSVSYPLDDVGAELSINDVALAKRTAAEFDNDLESIRIQNRNVMFKRMMKRIYNNVNATYRDADYGDLTIRALANQDGSIYPAPLGNPGAGEAEDNVYIVAGYVSGDISDTNNPLKYNARKLEYRFGETTGGDNIVTFIHRDETDAVESLVDFYPVPDNWIRVGDNADIPVRLPMVPGKIIGRSNGTWVSQWSEGTPSGYMLSVHLNEPQPLKMRVDEAVVAASLGRGLQMVVEEFTFPFRKWVWRHRFGFGAANRVNGVVLQLKASGSYDIPTAYQ